MPIMIVVGAQWGDEGKGKVVDFLTERATLVVRFQGGNNAGHTVIVDGKKTALKLLPSGILRPGVRCLLASGVVVDAQALLSEMQSLREFGVEITPERLGLAGEITLVMPYHRAIDTQREEQLAGKKIGTTGKGIGPAYEDSMSRYAIRLSDIFNEPQLLALVERNVQDKNKYLRAVLGSEVQFEADDIFKELCEVAHTLRPYVANVSAEVQQATQRGDYVVFEGAQGSLLDIYHGTYPYVTSSHTVSGFACVSAGFGPKNVDLVLGICKAYTTRVGSGPFPTEDHGEAGAKLRELGSEFGTVTGRPRRCGWFDAVAVRRAVRLNGIDSLIITKLDVLSEFESIKLGMGYLLDGKRIDDLPVCAHDIERIKADYQEVPGWKQDITGVTSFRELPVQAQNLLQTIESCIGCRVGGFSVGPDRRQTIILDDKLKTFAVL